MEILVYFAKVSLYLTLFYACYWLLLRRYTFFQWNRYYLIGTLVSATFLPFLSYPESVPEMPVVYQATANITSIQFRSQPVSDTFSWNELATIIYFVGAFVSLLIFGKQLRQLISFARTGEVLKLEGCKLILIDSDEVGSFSFLNTIVVNKTDYAHNLDTILRHEMAHIQQLHSLDILLLEMLRIAFWFNPLLILYKRSLQEVHEFLAEETAINRELYANFLLSYALRLPVAGLTNQFFKSSQIKSRVRMIYKSRSNKWFKSAYLVAIIFMGTVALFVASCEKAKERNQKEESSSLESKPDRMMELRGKVMNTDQIGLPGASIIVVGVQRGTTTDKDGEFMINAPANSKLQIAFIGYQTLTVDVNNRSRLEVSLALSSNSTLKSYEHAEVVDLSDERASNTIMPNPLLGPSNDAFQEFKNPKGNDTIIAPEVKIIPLPLFDGKVLVESAPESAASKHPKTDPETVFTVVEEQPQFPGGTNAMFNYLSRNIKYPVAAAEAGVQGRVFLSFVVSKTGNISDIAILKGIGFGCDAEAVRIVSSFPKWKPGTQNGVPVNVKYNLPIQFEIEKAKRTENDGVGQNSTGRPASNANTTDLSSTKSPENFLSDEIIYHQSSPAIQIRGSGKNTSFDKSNTLLIVDGKVNNSTDFFGTLKPESIASIQVINGKWAAEKYGHKNKSGVILIQTKTI